MARWHARQIPLGRASYAKLMSICAVSCCRITSHATLSPVEPEMLKVLGTKSYLDDAIQAIATELDDFEDFEYLQALGLTSLTAMESGNLSLLQRLLGLYHGALAQLRFSDERNWLTDISVIEREERRRLYWYMYRLEVHASLVLGHAVRCPELQCSVSYPKGPDPAYGEPLDNFEWLSGWNFVTDLYRGIEHLTSYFRSRRQTVVQQGRSLSTAFLLDYDPQEKILGPLTQALSVLPNRFKYAHSITHDIPRNRCGFQAANIICTYQVSREKHPGSWANKKAAPDGLIHVQHHYSSQCLSNRTRIN